jgi:hypothetical protein
MAITSWLDDFLLAFKRVRYGGSTLPVRQYLEVSGALTASVSGDAIVLAGGGGDPSSATPQPVGTTGVAGTSNEYSRGDHHHALGEATLRSVAATLTAPLACNGRNITNVADPVVASDVATRNWTLAQVNAIGPAARLPLDANHVLAYYCDETTGTTLANSGAAGGAWDLTLAGDYLLADRGLYNHGTGALRLNGQNAPNTGAAVTGAPAIVLGTECTLEAVIAAERLIGSAIAPLSLAVQALTAAGPYGGPYLAGYYGTPDLRGHVFVAGNDYGTGIAVGQQYTGRLHIAVVMRDNGGGSYQTEFWVNGVKVAQDNRGGTIGSITQIGIGNSPLGGGPWYGLIADVRMSNIARDAAYMRAATKAAGGM